MSDNSRAIHILLGVCVCVETLLDTTTGGIERERRERFCFSFFFRLP
jgi:hypothetical protein